MRKWLIGILFMGILSPCQTKAQADEIAQLLLNLEKLRQFKQILTDLKKSYDILNKGYNTVKDISQGNFSIHKTFLDGLMEVSPVVKRYHKVGEIVDLQIHLVRECKQANRRFRSSGYFDGDGLEYLGGVYDNLLRLSLQNLDELIAVTTAGKLRMSDDERLSVIDRIHAEMEDKVQFLRYFNSENSVLMLQLQREDMELGNMKEWHGVK